MPADIEQALSAARSAQARWYALGAASRASVIGAARGIIARRGAEFAEATARVRNRPTAEVITSEVIPLADACAFCARSAPSVLKPRPMGARGSPAWGRGLRPEVTREPFGVALVIGPSNYPLFLPGVQAIQALAAGNAVIVKPAPGCSAPMELLGASLTSSGLPDGTYAVTGEDAEAVQTAIRLGVDKVALTGSTATGVSILKSLASGLIPSVMELGGCDAVFVLPNADEALVVHALRFGMTINAGRTCVAPRRVYAPADVGVRIAERLGASVRHEASSPLPTHVAIRATELLGAALGAGAQMVCGNLPMRTSEEVHVMSPTVLAHTPANAALLTEDVFAPWIAFVDVASEDEALSAASLCRHALGASVFGPERAARAFARRVRAGVVTINDIIAPTADPRVPFGGRDMSGFGTTRGAEGLLEWTRPRCVISNKSPSRRHFDAPRPGDERMFLAFLQATHGTGWMCRLAGWRDAIGAAMRRT